LAAILSSLFLFDMRSSGGPVGASVFEFAARPFQPIILLFEHLQIKSSIAWNIAYLATLPLNYLLEFGFLLISGIWWFFARRGAENRHVQSHLAGGLVSVSLILPAIIWSGMEFSNDFGYRGVLPAQFIFLFCGAEFLDRYLRKARPSNPAEARLFQTATVAIVLGLLTNVTNVFLIRTSIGNFQQGTVLPGQMLRFDHSPEAFKDLRAAYVWLQQNTPKGTTVQENPVTWQLLAEGQYSQRPTVVYGTNPSFMIGVDHTDYLRVVADVRKVFEYGTTSFDLANTCSANRIDYLVVQNSDPIWTDRNNYVWTQTPVFASPRVRVLRCRN
jgi:hypothetical protein